MDMETFLIMPVERVKFRESYLMWKKAVLGIVKNSFRGTFPIFCTVIV